MRVKICGITNLEDALEAIKAGANALGFVFYEKSPRYISALEAKKIVDKLPPFIQTVGLFVNESSKHINDICFLAGMQLAQIIDDEDKTEFDNLNVKYIEVIRAKSKEDLENLEESYYLIDAFVEEFGGAGKRVALEWFDKIDCSKIILAGGLKASNLKELKNYNFFAVDVSSGVESSKGKKDKEKMKEFIQKAHEI
ncbi:phosphoribosylanthranilate isomerase [Malaciobacter marinus]|uniref:N-(5'-phosphoribosyl)anthranilate isomerase n=1 Tax=Malaciobacter marinus TaxID=505249 RepID=A0A347TLT6_9BACT|nr:MULTISPECIES: phosphoribosylanthranilate isomerase [Malaciobacter]AXX87564.1 phosphoribosylanthranilate isomerase [Malaciobacter marinus]PHO12009.1 N-(5'-phosphoribosyl)anthranilate isomerase [Malaciobacter marinus]PHO14471.1 N-(5'-phosphoribosyl)anthranilate isomerase [Malaciobacter marinus]RYA24491.1 phosphoribosylanthranilate isomerase [Malaciobacter halophilus]